MSKSNKMYRTGSRRLFACVLLGAACFFRAAALPAQEVNWDRINKQLISLFEQKKLSDALELGEKTLEKARKQFRKKDLPADAASLMINLGILYKRSGDFKNAERHLRDALSLREKYFGLNDPVIGKIAINLGGIYKRRGKFYEAEYYFSRALNIRKTNFGPEHPQTAPILNHLSGIYQKLEKYDKAEEFLKQAVEISKKAYGENDSRMAALYFNYGDLFLEQEKWAAAEEYFLKALSIFELKGDDNPELVYPLDKLVQIYKIRGKLTEAESFFRRALAIRRTIFGDDHIEVANSLNNIGVLYLMENNPKAEKHFTDALRICEEQLGANDPAIVGILNNLIQYHKQNGNQEKVSRLQARVRKIL